MTSCTDDTTSMGRLMAGPPVTGSVTFALFTQRSALSVASALEIDVATGSAQKTPGTREKRAGTVRSRWEHHVVSFS